jgi:hypothetical protein
MEDIIDLKEIEWKVVDHIFLAKDLDPWRAVVRR